MIELRRVTGIGAAGCLALALLAGGCVLAAAAGPRQAQAMETRALQQTIDGVSPLNKTIVAASDWTTIDDTFGIDYGSGLNLTPANLADVTTQLRRDFIMGPLRLAPRSADWVAMTPAPYPLATALPVLKGIPAKLEVAYRSPLAGHVRLVAGRLPATVPADQPATDLQVVITPPTARVFGLRPGSRLVIGVPAQPGQFSQVKLTVTGIVEPAGPGSAFWRADPLLPRPALDYEPGGTEIWNGAVIADPGELNAIQSIFGHAGLDIGWEFPVDTAGLHGPAQALSGQVGHITNQRPRLTGHVAPMTNALTVTSGLAQPLAAFAQASSAVSAVLWMVYVGLAVAALVILLLAARMIAARRSAELTVYRARGASLAQVFWLGFLGAGVVCAPAAALAWTAALLLVRDSAPAGATAWWPGIAALLLATAGPGVVAAWQQRLPRRGHARRRRRGTTRVVVEITVGAAAIGGIIVSRTQAGAGDLYASAAPVLVAALAVIVVLRLYQVLVRGLARASARQRGIIGFLGLARAAQATVTLALPAMTLVLAVTVAAFAGMVRDAVVRAETAQSWRATGADVVVAAAPWQPDLAAAVISPATVRALAAGPGVQHAAAALVIPVRTGNDALITSIAVDPASYATLVASTQGYTPVNAARLTAPHGHGPVPVLASPAAAVELSGLAGRTILAQQGLAALRVRVVGELRSTPALPVGGAFIVLPRSALRGVGEPVNLMLLTGPSIDVARLRATIAASTRGSSAPAITSRPAVLDELAGAPLQQGTFLLFALAIGCADALALAVMLLELALGAADREPTMARLATMGLTEAQRVRLAAFEVLPAIAASAVAAIACAIALPRLVAPAINLSVFTQSGSPVLLRPDVASFALPLAGLLAVTVIALGYEIRSRRGHSAATMRAS
jgi:putative ABC transport system permease protein